MPNNFFITGMPKAGKTTLIRRIIKNLEAKGYRVGGFISPEIKEHGTREGFYIEDIETGKKAMLATIKGDGPKIAKYHVKVKDFENLALETLQNEKKYDVLIIDEIGRMELESVKFGDELESILQSDIPVVASLHGDFVREYENFGKIYYLTETNRSGIESELMDGLVKILPKKMPLAGEKVSKKKPTIKKTGKGETKQGINKKQGTKRKPEKVAKKEEPKNKPGKPEEKKGGFFEGIKKFLGV